MAQVTPIKYRMDYDPDELTLVTLSQRMVGGEIRKRKVPKAKEDSIESILQVMVEFDEVAQATVLDFDGNDYYNNFRMVLPAVLRDDWDEAVRAQGTAVAARTEATFRACQRQWMTSFISDGSAEDLKEYIETTMKKEREDSIYHLVSRAKTLRKRHFQLLARGAIAPPVDNQRMTDRELIRAMFRGVLSEWQTEFQRHHNLRTCTIDDFQTFMTREKATYDAKQKAAQAQKDRSKQKDKTQHHGNRGSRKRSSQSLNNRNDRNSKSKNKNHCRRHPQGDHDWIDCWENPRGRNYRPDYANRRQQQRNNQHGSHQNNQQHYFGRQNYYQQQTLHGQAPGGPVGDGRTQGGTPFQQPMRGSYYNGASIVCQTEQVAQPLHLQYTNNPSLLPPNPLQEHILYHQEDRQEEHPGQVGKGMHYEMHYNSDNGRIDNTTGENRNTRLQSQTTQETNSIGYAQVYTANREPIHLTIEPDEVGPHLSPCTIMHAHQIQGQYYEIPLRVLLDLGSDDSHIKSTAIPKGINPKLGPTKYGTTISGISNSNKEIILQDLIFPEFSSHYTIQSHTFNVFTAPSYYDVIIGRDLLYKMGAKFDTVEGTMSLFDKEIPMRDRKELHNRNQFFYHCFHEPEDVFFQSACYQQQSIKASKYERVDIEDVIAQQEHLDDDDKRSLRRVLEKHTKLFDGNLGRYPNKKMDLELLEGAQPVHLKAYAVPRIHHEVFKNELKRLCQIGVLTRVGATEWAFPSFIIPKKDGRVRWISDFRKLNEVIRRKQYPLPRIQDILRKRPGYHSFTKIDISMQYYTFELTERAKDLCVIVTPFGKFRYNVAPMGVKQSPDFAQEVMEQLFLEDEDVEVYLDDIGIWGKSRQHIEQVERRVLTKLEDNGFTVNPLKCEWRVKETDWLGHWMTPVGLKPWKKKIQAILDMQPPENITQVRSFVGSVNFYRDLFPHRSHLLAPLTELPTKGKFQWLPKHTTAFNIMKAILCRDCLVRYPDHNIPFEIYTDASNYQLGAVLLQQGHPIAYFSRKLNSAQRNYDTMSKELLSIYETLKEFQSMLMGATITIYTDHKNLISNPSTSQRILRQAAFISEFDATLIHIDGARNFLADMFSRLPLRSDLSVPSHLEEVKNLPDLVWTKQDNEAMYSASMYDCLDHPDVATCFLHLPEEEGFSSPLALDYQRLAQLQQQDPELQQRRWQHPMQFPSLQMGSTQLIAHQPLPNEDAKFCLPTQQLSKLVQWYHEALSHCGAERLYKSINSHFTHPKLRATVRQVCETCDACQRNNLLGRQYGHLPVRIAEALPWQEVHVDLIGPWEVKFQGDAYDFYALTCIDPATGYPDAVRLQNKTARHTGLQFENLWCARYPKPLRCRHDPGKEFVGEDFKKVLRRLNIAHKPCTVRNPQTNAICERLHQTIAKAIRIMIHHHPPQNVVNVAELVDTCIASSLHAIRATVHSTLGVSPGAMVFHRDMLHDIPISPDFQAIQEKRQARVDYNLLKANAKRIDHKYQVNDEVLQIQHGPKKMDERATGPYTIRQVLQSGAVVLDKGNGIKQTLNIRWIRPYRRPTQP